jgi:hypothetical protein
MLRRAIRSVLSQTFPGFRVCIYDNASGDETSAVVEEFRKRDSRVEYVCRPNNIGMYANFMDGAKRVETPFFSFLADDDLMLPHFLETALSGFQRHPEAALSILPTLCMSPRGLILLVTNLQWPEGLLLPPTGMLSTLHLGNPGLQAMLIRKAVWDEFGGFDEATDPGGEYDFDMRVMARLPAVVSKKPGAIQVVHGGAFTTAGGLRWIWPCMPRIISKLAQNRDLQPAIRQQAVEKMQTHMVQALLRRGVVKSISRGEWESAQRAADLLVQECPQSRGARTIRWASAACRRFPGSPFIVHALSALRALRAGERIMRNLGLQWQFRAYSRFLRTSTVAASSVNLGSAGCDACDDGEAARGPCHPHSARKTFS